MRIILLTLLATLIVSSAFAQDPRETVEYWKSSPQSSGLPSGLPRNKWDEANSYMQKCWDPYKIYFVVKKGSKAWNICCAIYAVAHDRTLTNSKEIMEARQKEVRENPEFYKLLTDGTKNRTTKNNNKDEWVTPKINKFQIEPIGK